MLQKGRVLALLLLVLTTGCVKVGRDEPIRETNYTRMKQATPAYPVNKAGEPQVVNVLVEDENGKMVPGKLDVNGTVNLDEPTYELQKAALEYVEKKGLLGEVEKSMEPTK